MNKDNQTPYELGKSGEAAAVNYLARHNYIIVATGFRLFRGEIDIIAYDKQTLVFVEVKTRRSSDFGSPEESVTPAKQQQLRKIAQGFLTLNKIKDVECRFDVISLIKKGGNYYQIRHFKNAF